MPEFWGDQCLSLAKPRVLGPFGAGPAGETPRAGRNRGRPGLGGTEDRLWWGQGQTWCFRGLLVAPGALGCFFLCGANSGGFGLVWGAGEPREAVRGFCRGFWRNWRCGEAFCYEGWPPKIGTCHEGLDIGTCHKFSKTPCFFQKSTTLALTLCVFYV